MRPATHLSAVSPQSEPTKRPPRFKRNQERGERGIAAARLGGKASVMDTLGGDRPAPDQGDDCDLALLNLYVLLDALRLRHAALRRRILAHWETFQRHQARAEGDVHNGDTG